MGSVGRLTQLAHRLKSYKTKPCRLASANVQSTRFFLTTGGGFTNERFLQSYYFRAVSIYQDTTVVTPRQILNHKWSNIHHTMQVGATAQVTKATANSGHCNFMLSFIDDSFLAIYFISINKLGWIGIIRGSTVNDS